MGLRFALRAFIRKSAKVAFPESRGERDATGYEPFDIGFFRKWIFPGSKRFWEEARSIE